MTLELMTLEITEKLTKQLKEVRYLQAENVHRYRPIIRFLYNEYEKINYSHSRETVFEQFKGKPGFEDYTLELCESDLTALVNWKNLTAVQDSENINSIEEFKNRRFKYHLSEYTVEIERMVIRLEKLSIESASLEPQLFERIRNSLAKITEMTTKDKADVSEWWYALNNDFIRLNHNYQDYLRDFYQAKNEELMKSEQFKVFKNDMVRYLKDFVMGFQQNNYLIEEILKQVAQEDIDTIMDILIEYERSIPKLDVDFDYEALMINNIGKFNSIVRWFIGDNTTPSEGMKLRRTTEQIIARIAKYANQISELQGTVASQQDQYSKIIEMFCSTSNIEDAHKLSSVVFGVFNVKRFKGDLIRESDSLDSNSYDEKPAIIKLKTRSRELKEKAPKVALIDKTVEKEKMYKKYLKELEAERALIKKYLNKNEIRISDLANVHAKVRKLVLKLISRATSSPNYRARADFGVDYELILPEKDDYCTIVADDGMLELPNYTILFDRSDDDGIS